MSTQLRKLSLYPEFRTNEGIDGVINYITSLHKGFGEVFPKTLNTRQQDRYEDKFAKDFSTVNNQLFYTPRLANDKNNKISMTMLVTRPQDKDKILKSIYDDPTLGLGIGINQFFYQVSRLYLNITRAYATNFLKSQGNYQIALHYHEPVNQPIIPTSSNERWGCDNISMDHYTEFGDFAAILTIVDYYSKKVWAIPLRHGYTSGDNFKALMSVCEKEQTYPHIIQVDNGSQFQKDFKSSIDAHNKNNPTQKIKLAYTTPYNPTSNGLVERMNREIRKKIRAGFIKHNNLEWSKYLDDYCENINNQRSSTTGYTPNQLWTPKYVKFKSSNSNNDESKKLSDYSTPEEIRNSIQTKQYKKSIEQLKSGIHTHKFKKDDIVRMKLPAYKEDKILATKVGKREKADMFRKYNVVNYTLYRFKIDKVIPSPIKNQEQFKQIKNTIPDKELDKMLHDNYTLLQEVGGEYVPYKLKADNGKMYTPKFNASDLIFIPKDSTGFTVTPTTAQIEKLNTYDVVRKDPTTREPTTTPKAKSTPKPKQVAERMTTRAKTRTENI